MVSMVTKLQTTLSTLFKVSKSIILNDISHSQKSNKIPCLHSVIR